MTILEFKAILVTLLATFEFAQREESFAVVRRITTVLTEPVVVGEERLGFRLPVRVKLLAQH